MSPLWLILIGFIMVVLGFLFPFLMVLKVIQATYWLSFLSFAISFGGLLLGMVGSAYYVKEQRRKS